MAARKTWDKIQFCVVLALIVTTTSSICSFGEVYFADKRIRILKSLGGNSPILEEMAENHWTDGQADAFAALLLVFVLVESRKKKEAESKEASSADA